MTSAHWSTYVDVPSLKKIWQIYIKDRPLPFLDKWLKHEGKFNPELRQFSVEHQLILATAMMDGLRFLQLAVAMEALYQQKISKDDLVDWDNDWTIASLESLPNQYFWFWVVLRTDGDIRQFSVKDHEKRVAFFHDFFANRKNDIFSPENLLWYGLRPGWKNLLIARFEQSQWKNAQLIEFMEKKNQHPPVWLRLQKNMAPEEILKSLQSQGVETMMDEQGNLGLLGGRGVNNSEEYKKGLIEIQDLASQLIAKTLDVKPGQKVWDVCAGAGGKSLAIASRMNNKGMLLATDLHQYKLDELKRRAKRAEIFNIRQFLWNADEPLRLPKEVAQQKGFDWILIDAPCSASGTWRRNPDALWRFSKKDTQELIQLQEKILHQAQFSLKESGHLVYATCSWQLEENELQIEKFLQSHPDFELVKQTILGSPDLDSDTMFVAVMRRT